MKHRIFILFYLFIFSDHSLADDNWLEQIKTGLNDTLGHKVNEMAHNMHLSDFDYKIDIQYIDPKLNLTSCEIPITIEELNPLELGRSHIKVSCEGKRAWALNVPVDIALNAQVVVSQIPLSRKIVLKSEMLTYQKQNLAELNNGYFLDIDHLTGKQLKRAIAGHTVLNSHLVSAGLMILKGDTVMIMAKKAGMRVKMPGEALSDGREGRQIRVKNTHSQRIIVGKVVAPGLVEVNF